jgi:hypothetical protein
VGLGPGDGVLDEAGDLLEVGQAGLEVADDDLELGEAVPQGGQLAPGVLGDAPEARDQVADRLALALAAQGQPVARADGAGVQVVAALQLHDGLVEVLVGLPGVVQLGLDVEHAVVLAGAAGALSRNARFTWIGRIEQADRRLAG